MIDSVLENGMNVLRMLENSIWIQNAQRSGMKVLCGDDSDAKLCFWDQRVSLKYGASNKFDFYEKFEVTLDHLYFIVFRYSMKNSHWNRLLILLILRDFSLILRKILKFPIKEIWKLFS